MTLKQTDPPQFFVAPAKRVDGNFDFDECDNLLSRDYVQSNQIQPVRIIQTVGASAQEVKITDGSDTLAINGDGSINVKHKTAITVSTGKTGTSIGTAGTTLYTVTAGKTFYMTSIHIGTATSAYQYELLDNATIKGGANIGTGGINWKQNFGNTPIPFTHSVVMKGSATATHYFTIVGYEE